LQIEQCLLFRGSQLIINTYINKFYLKNFKSYIPASTPLTHIGALPGCDADVSTLPKIYQETVSTYCNIKPGGPGKVDIVVKPSTMPAFKKRNGKFADGDTMVLWLKDIKAIFVTQYKGGKPLYGVFTEDGKDFAIMSYYGI
jgi:hypothetical protein